MGAAEIILTVAIPCLIGAGFALAAMSDATATEFLVARGSFVLAGFLGCGLTLFWLVNADWTLMDRVVAGVIVLGFAISGTLAAVGWVGRRERRSKSNRDNASAKPDMTIWQAINYLATQSQWSYQPRGQAEPHALLDEALRSCSISAWGQKCLTQTEQISEPLNIQLSGSEEPIPCSEWAHMSIVPRWIGYAGFPLDEYPTAANPHLTSARGGRWICYGHLRVSSQEIKTRWPPRLQGGAAVAEQAEKIPLLEAATRGYEQTRGTLVGGVANIDFGDEDRREATLRWYCFSLADRIDIYGNWPPSRVPEKINTPTRLKRHSFRFRDGALVFQEHNGTGYFENLYVMAADLSKALASIKNISPEPIGE